VTPRGNQKDENDYTYTYIDTTDNNKQKTIDVLLEEMVNADGTSK
jgi:hypothetical protein